MIALRVKKIVANILGYNVEELDNKSLGQDLGADDLDMIEILMNLESEFNINIPDENFHSNFYLKVEELIRLVEDIVGNRKEEFTPFLEKVKPAVKTVKKRVIKFTEYTYSDGTQNVKPVIKGFSDFEILGILDYYRDTLKINMLNANRKKDGV